MLTTLLIVISGGLLLFFYQKRKVAMRQKSKLANSSSTFERSQYRCAIIETQHFHCRAVKKIAGQPILVAHAPVLPLADCDVSSCDCRYVRREDRREEDRRTPYPTMADTISNINDQREKKDRRQAST